MMRPRLEYKPGNGLTSQFDDVFLHSFDENDELPAPPETGCIPPFVIAFLKWLKLWKTDTPSNRGLIDDMV